MSPIPARRQDFGARPQLTWLPVGNLAVSPEYQRSLETPSSKRLIAKIAEGFRWSAFGTILATPDGFERWLIIDGQHRVEGAKAVGISTVPAVVIEEASAQEQAQAFVRANRDRVPMSAQALYHARVLAGDRDALIIADICKDAGIEITRFNLSAVKVPARKTAAVPALLRMLSLYGEATTRKAVKAIAETYGKDAGALRSPFFLAAGMFLYQGGGEQGLRLALMLVGWRGLEVVGLGLGGSSAVTDMVAKLRTSIAAKPSAANAPQPAPVAAPKPPAPKTSPAAVPPAKPVSATYHYGAKKPTAPVPDHKRDDEQAAIEKFLANKGATVVMAPEAVAEFLREAGHQVLIREQNEVKRGPHNTVKRVRVPTLDGKDCTLADLYRAANALRTKVGLPELSLPVEAAA